MSQTKYRLSDDVKKMCISLVRGYERRVNEYHEKRSKVLYGTPPSLNTLPSNNHKSDLTANKVIQLEELEQCFDTQAMKAVEQAKLMIGVDFEDEDIRHKLTTAIYDSCLYGRNFYFEYYDLPMGSNNFYKRRREFLWNIAKNISTI